MSRQSREQTPNINLDVTLTQSGSCPVLTYFVPTLMKEQREVKRTITQLGIGAAVAAVALTGCSSSSSSTSGPDPKSAKATSVADFGGLDKLVPAAKKEGKLHVITLPRDWANYGPILHAFTQKYR